MARKFGILLAAITMLLTLTAPAIFAASEGGTGGGGVILPLPIPTRPQTKLRVTGTQALAEVVPGGGSKLLGIIEVYAFQITTLKSLNVEVEDGKINSLELSWPKVLEKGYSQILVTGIVLGCNLKDGSIAWKVGNPIAVDQYGDDIECIYGFPIRGSSYVIKKAKPGK